MAEPKKAKYYVVWSGRVPGIYTTWINCKKQIDAFPGARYKSFLTNTEAEAAYKNQSHTSSRVEKKLNGRPPKPTGEGWCVDAACSGNPGVMEYRGVDLATGKQLFLMGPFQQGTNNIGEFLAIVHGLALSQQQNIAPIIYTDSMNGIIWVMKKECRTKLKPNEKNKPVFELITRAQNWLMNNSFKNKIVKWETEFWGEIPADFGRK